MGICLWNLAMDCRIMPYEKQAGLSYWIEKGQDLKVDESSKPASSNDLAAIQSFLFNLDGSLFGTSKLEYKLSHTDNIQGTLIYRMQQTHLGLPLFDAAAVARVSNGQLSSLYWECRAD